MTSINAAVLVLFTAGILLFAIPAAAQTPGEGKAFTVESSDGGFSLRLGSRFQIDNVFHGSDLSALGSDTAIRRAYLQISGGLLSDWNYKFQYDFARPGPHGDAVLGIRDALIQYTGFDPFWITVGNFKEPLGLERLSGTLAATFIEYSLPDLFTPDRHVGTGAGYHGDGWTAALGVFGERPEDGITGEGAEAWDLAGRLTLLPVRGPGRLWHLGLVGRWHQANDSLHSLRFSSRPESNLTSVRLIDTGVLADVDNYQTIGLEMLGIRGPCSLQGEYYYTRVNRAGSPDLAFSGWYVYGSWTLTGESRGYKTRSGLYDRMEPERPVTTGGAGAWELALRYSTVDLSDGDIIGGAQDDLTLGVNWYATGHLRLAVNYIRVLKLDRPGNAADGNNGDIVLMRWQVDF